MAGRDRVAEIEQALARILAQRRAKRAAQLAAGSSATAAPVPDMEIPPPLASDPVPSTAMNVPTAAPEQPKPVDPGRWPEPDVPGTGGVKEEPAQFVPAPRPAVARPVAPPRVMPPPRPIVTPPEVQRQQPEPVIDDPGILAVVRRFIRRFLR